ncbi:MAG: S-layer homology domain-containing protein [Oscillospiraceae bacterium]|jgi:hypothetical protein|nr:S-layer homology domain-containing protein [Oscillospiraceae bacterium]
MYREGNYTFRVSAVSGIIEFANDSPYSEDSPVAHITLDPSVSTLITVTASEGGRIIAGGGRYRKGAFLELFVTANAGYTIDGWYENGEKISSSEWYYFLVENERTLQARFTYTGNLLAPTIAYNPLSQSKNVGKSARFEVIALSLVTPLGTLYYQWQKDGEDIPGATESVYEIDAVTVAHAGAYTCLVTTLYRLAGEPAVSGDVPFPDVKTGEWYTDAVIWAAQAGLVKGYLDGTFGWNDPVTREQAVTVLYNYAKAKGWDVSAANGLAAFEDADEISDWALPALKWAVAVGLLKGRTETTTVPAGSSTRAELATLLKRFADLFDLPAEDAAD